MSGLPDGDLHADPDVPAVVHASDLAWVQSPSPGVWRKRLHRSGPAESGRVTSIVRYEPGSRFAEHGHPEGEEILVLEGVFSDEHGDWPAGTYLLNPEGFRHAPFSEPGCVLFVKLRQLPGRDREHVVVDTRSAPWTGSPFDGIAEMPLARDRRGDRARLEHWQPGRGPGDRAFARGVEILVVSGEIEDETGRHGPRSWVRLPEGATHRARAVQESTLFVREASVRYAAPPAG